MVIASMADLVGAMREGVIPRACGRRDPLDSQLADRLEEAYRWLRAV